MKRLTLSLVVAIAFSSLAFGQGPSLLPPAPGLLPPAPVSPAPASLPPTPNEAPSLIPPPSSFGMPLPPEPPAPEPATVTYVPGDGLTVSMMNDTSRLKLFGQFSTIGMFSTSRPYAAGLPLLMLPPSPYGQNTNTFDINGRQTAFGAAFSGPEVMGFTPGAYFLGFIQNSDLTNDGYGLLPYQAYGELKNQDWRIAGGLQQDVFNPISPTVITLGKMYGSGNTGSFRGQFRLENFYKPSDAFQLTTQLALSEPVSTLVSGGNRLIEDNGWPNIESRIAAGLGTVQDYAGGRKQRPIEIGISGVIGQLRNSLLLTAANDPNVPKRAVELTWGLGIDGQVAVTKNFGMAGELYTGQAMGEYNGGILQSFNPRNFQAIRSSGGWGEVYYYFNDKVHLHTGYGIDAPLRQDLAAGQFARNQTYFTNLIWDVSKVLQFNFEVDYRSTDYIGFPTGNGVLFTTQMLYKF